MRLLYVSAVLGLTALIVSCAIEKRVHAQSYPIYGAFNDSPVRVVYYRPYMPVYDARPTYYAYYASPTYSSYYSSCVCYTPPVYCQEPYHDQQSQPSEDSSAQLTPAPPTPAQPATTVTVGAYDNRFSPPTINVQPGTTVRWVNAGQHAHTVTDKDGRWDSGDIKPGATYSATFNRPGVYYYYCRHHAADKMQGVVVVGSANANVERATQSTEY
jgi:plastocyanin